MGTTKPECQGCAVNQGYVPVETLSAEIKEPQKFTGDSEMRRAFEIEYGQSWTDPDWRKETGIWASAWHKATASAQLAAVQQGVQPGEEEGAKVMALVEQLGSIHEEIGANQNGTEESWRVKGLIHKKVAALAAATHPTQKGLADDAEVPEAVLDAVAAALGDAYDCGRVWEAWSYGTMTSQDFYPVAEDSDRVAEIARAALAAQAAKGVSDAT